MADSYIGPDITSYDDALEALSEVLKSIEVHVKPEDVKYMPWDSKDARSDKRMKVAQETNKKIAEVRNLYGELISLRVASDVLSSLEDVSETKTILSRVQTEQSKRRMILSKEAKDKLKKVPQKHYHVGLLIATSPKKHLEDFPMEVGGDLSASIHEGMQALAEHSTEFQDARMQHEKTKTELSTDDKKLSDLTSKVAELKAVLEKMLNMHFEYIAEDIPFNQREVIVGQEEAEQAERIIRTLQEFLNVVGRYVELHTEIANLEFNLEVVRKTLSDRVVYGTIGYELISELEGELTRDLKAAKDELLQLADKIYGGSKRIEAIEGIISTLEQKNFRFEADVQKKVRWDRPEQPEDKATAEQKQGLALNTVKETARARTIFEEYLREIAGKGPERESFKEFAARHHIEQAYLDYAEVEVETENKGRRL